MKAMLLSAGLGHRMLPLTGVLPKPAIPVLGRAIALQILERMARFGVTDAVLNLHHLPGRVEALLADAAGLDLPAVHFSRETDQILGTGGGILKAAGLLRGAGPILVHNGDFLSDIDLRAVAAAHGASGKPVTLVLAPPRPGYARVDVDPEGHVVSLGGEPAVDPAGVAASYLFTGCHVIDEGVIERIPAGRPSGIVADVYRDLAGKRALGAFLHHGFWWEFGTPESYLEGCLRLIDLPADRRRDVAVHDPVTDAAAGRVAMGPGAWVDPDARVEGRACLGAGSHVGAGARLRDCVVLPGARVGRECRLESAIVAPETRVPDGFSCRRAMIVDGSAGNGALPGVERAGELLVRSFS